MGTLVYRITAVLAGQSAVVTVIGRDTAGRELQIGLTPDQARALQVGQLLVLQLSAHAVPELDTPPRVDVSPAEPVAVVTACGGEADDAEICRMLGLA